MRIEPVNPDACVRNLRRAFPAQLTNDLDDVRDPEYVRVTQHAAVRVVRQPPTVEIQARPFNECTPFAKLYP